MKKTFALLGFLLTSLTCLPVAEAAYFADGMVIHGTASVATAGGTTTLTRASKQYQSFSGSSAQTVVLPDATAMREGGGFWISNDSTGLLTVNYNGGSTATTLTTGEFAFFLLLDDSTAAGVWDVQKIGPVANTALTASRAVATDASGALVSSATTATELGYVNGVTSSLCGISQSCTETNKTLAVGSNSITGTADRLAVFGSGGSLEASSVTATQVALLGTATSSNTASTLVLRDGSGDFAAGTITATLSGNASTATALAANPSDCGAGTVANSIDASGNLTCAAIADATVDAAAAIARSKLATGTADHVVINSGTGAFSSEATLAVSRGGTNIASYTAGDLLYASGPTTLSKLAAGSASQVLKGGTTPSWGSVAGGDGVNQNLLGLDSNYVANNTTDRDAEASVGNWAAYADAAGTEPVDMTGGSPNTTVARSTSSPINGTGHFLLTLTTGATRQGEGAAVPVYIPPAYRGQMLEFSFPFTTTGTITEDDIKLYAYDVTNATVITPYYAGKVLGAGPSKAVAIFPTATTTAQIRVGVHIARASNTGAVTVLFDDVAVSPSVATYGMAGSDWISFTPTGAWSSNTTYTGFYRRIGDTAEMQVRVATSGAPTAANLSVNPPSGLTVDTAKLTGTAVLSKPLCYGTVNDSSATGVYNVVGHYLSGAFQLTLINTTSTYGTATNVSNTVPMSFGATDLVDVNCVFPVSNWSSNVTMANSSQFKISSYLASGSRVTGSDPTSLGQYRSYLRDAGANTFTETNGTPGTTPSASNGIQAYNGATWASADANNEPTRYRIFIGRNKSYQVVWYASSGRTGDINTDPITLTSSLDAGYRSSYDPVTGIVDIQAHRYGNSTHVSGLVNASATANDPFFDIIVSENALAVGMDTTAVISNNRNERVERARLNLSAAGTVAITSQSGSWLSSVTASSSIVTMNFTSGIWSNSPDCTFVCLNNAANTFPLVTSAPTTSAANIACVNYSTGSAALSSAISVMCMGPR
jgi:hypothetical protein